MTHGPSTESAAATSVLQASLRQLFPEVAAGGFTRRDGTVAFFTRVDALLGPGMRVLNVGAGRGSDNEDPVDFRRHMQSLRGRVDRVIGIDIDGAVLANPDLDEALVVGPRDSFPVDDGSIDLVLIDRTLEHVDDPAHVSAEIRRVLRPGGWVCGRTPSKWGYVGLSARLVPNSLHVTVLRLLQPWRQKRDVFPTRYRLNTKADLVRQFPSDRYLHCSFGHYPEPLYFGAGHASLLRVGDVVQHVLPPPTLMVFIQKLDAGPR